MSNVKSIMIYLGIFLAELFLLYLFARKLHQGFGKFFYKITRSKKVTMYLFALLFLPGTLLHELSHFFTALFLLVPVGNIDLFPKMTDEHEIKLGSVPIGQTDFVRRAIIGVAPFIFGLFALFGLAYYVTTGGHLINILSHILFGYVVFQISNTMFSSKKDLEGSWKMIVLFIFAAVLFRVFGLHLDIVSIGVFLTPILSQVVVFLTIPIIINFVFLLLFRFAKLV